MNFYRSDFKHKIYGLYTGKYGTVFIAQQVTPDYLHVLYHNAHLNSMIFNQSKLESFGFIVKIFLPLTIPHSLTTLKVADIQRQLSVNPEAIL